MAANKIITRYWAQCVKCKKVKDAWVNDPEHRKGFPRASSDPNTGEYYLPGLWCWICKNKMEKANQPKPQKCKGGVSILTTPLPCRVVFTDRGRFVGTDMNFPWEVFSGYGADRHWLGSGERKDIAVENAKAARSYIACPGDESDDAAATSTEITVDFPVDAEGDLKPRGMSDELRDAFECKFHRENHDWPYFRKRCQQKPYVIPPSKVDPSKPRTRVEFDKAVGIYRFFVHDEELDIGLSESEAINGAKARAKSGRLSGQVSILDDLFPVGRESQ